MIDKTSIVNIISSPYTITFFRVSGQLKNSFLPNRFFDMVALITFEDLDKIYKGNFSVFSSSEWTLRDFEDKVKNITDVIILKPSDLDKFIDAHDYISYSTHAKQKHLKGCLDKKIRNNKLDKIFGNKFI